MSKPRRAFSLGGIVRVFKDSLRRERANHAPLPPGSPDAAMQRGHEFRDVHLRGIVLAATTLIGTVVITLFMLWGFFNLLQGARQAATRPSSPLVTTPIIPPQPRLQVNAAAEYQSVRATQEAQINGYQWIDQNAGKVRIPIDQAMNLLAQRGLPTTPPVTPTVTPAQPPATTPGAAVTETATP